MALASGVVENRAWVGGAPVVQYLLESALGQVGPDILGHVPANANALPRGGERQFPRVTDQRALAPDPQFMAVLLEILRQ